MLNKKEIDRLPKTLKRSSEKAQATYMHTLESAEEVHGDGEAAHRIAFGSLKHSFEKVGDHWEAQVHPGRRDLHYLSPPSGRKLSISWFEVHLSG